MPDGWVIQSLHEPSNKLEIIYQNKGSSAKGAFAFSQIPKGLCEGLTGACHGLHVAFWQARHCPTAWDPLAPWGQGRAADSAAEASWRSPSHFGPHSKLAAFTWSPRKSQHIWYPRVATLCLNLETPNSLCLVNSLLKLCEWMFHYFKQTRNSIFNFKVLKFQSAALLY